MLASEPSCRPGRQLLERGLPGVLAGPLGRGRRLVGQQRVATTDKDDVVPVPALDDRGREPMTGAHRDQCGRGGEQLHRRRRSHRRGASGAPEEAVRAQGGHGEADVLARGGATAACARGAVSAGRPTRPWRCRRPASTGGGADGWARLSPGSEGSGCTWPGVSGGPPVVPWWSGRLRSRAAIPRPNTTATTTTAHRTLSRAPPASAWPRAPERTVPPPRSTCAKRLT